MKDIDQNFEWFEKNVELIKAKHKITDEDWIVISKQKFIKKFKKYGEASEYALTNLKAEGYIIQRLSDLDPLAKTFGSLIF